MVGFLAMAVAGFALLLLSNIFGGHDHDVGVDHFDHEAGGHEAMDKSASGPSPVSLRTISIFIAVFGLGGFLARVAGVQSNWAATGIGFLGGFLSAWVAYLFILLSYAQQASSTVSVAEVVGQIAQVTEPISVGGVGEVTLVVKGQRKDFLARSDAGEIPAGAKVKIVENRGASVVVTLAQ